MVLVSVLADKGGGVTTSALALAAVWPAPVLLAECDVAGADLPFRLPAADGRALAADRGMVSLATAVRGQAGAELVWEHTQTVQGGLPVLVGPALPEHATAMASAWTPISGMLAGLAGTDVLADCGRILGDTPLLPVLRRSALLLLVARDTVEGVAHLRHGLQAVARAVNAAGSSAGPSALARTAVLLLAAPRQDRSSRRQVEQVLSVTAGLAGVPVLGVLAWDPAGAEGLRGQWGRRLDRSALVSSARTVATAVYDRVHAGDLTEPAQAAAVVQEPAPPAAGPGLLPQAAP